MGNASKTGSVWHRLSLLESLPSAIMCTAFVLGLLIWTADAVIDSLFFYEGGFFHLLVLDPPQHEIYIRLLMLLCFLAFGGVASSFVLKLQRIRGELQTSEKNLRTTLQSIGDGVIATDTTGRIKRMNEVSESLTGWNRHEAMDLPLNTVFRIVNAVSRNPVANPVRKVLQEGSIQGLANHTVLIARDGREFQIADSASPIREDDGQITGVVLVFRDVTEQYRQEEDLRRHRRLLANVVEGTDAGIWEKNLRTGELYFDVSWLRHLGYDLGDFSGMPPETWRQLLHPDDLEKSQRLIAEHLNGHADVYECEIRVQHRDGSWVWLLDRGKITEWTEDGEALMLSGTVQDITERKWEEELVRMRLRLVEYSVDHSLDELLTKALDEMGAFLDSPIGFYHFVEADQKTLSLQQWSTETLRHHCRADGKGLHYSLDRAGVWVDCVREGKPVIHNDYPSLPHKHGLPEEHTPVARELVVPVWRREKIVAIVGMGNKPRDYTEQDARHLQFLADVTHEIVLRKQSEENSLRSESHYRTVFETTGTGMIIFGEDTIISRANANFEALSGYSREEVEGRKSWTEFMHPNDLEQMKSYHDLRGRDPEAAPQQYEPRFLDRSGREHNILLSVDMIPGTELRVASFMDITQRRRTEDILSSRFRLMQYSMTHSLSELLTATIDEAEKLTGSRIGFFHFLTPEQEKVSLQAWSSRTKSEECEAEVKGMEYDLNQAGIWVDCFHEGKAVIHNDYGTLPHRKGMPQGHPAVSRELAVPILRNGRTVAILGVGDKELDYDEADIEAVSLLANLAWDLADRKHSEEEARHLNRVLRAVRNVNQLITVERDRDRLIQGMCDNFVETRGFGHAWIALLDSSGGIASLAETGTEGMLTSLQEGGRLQELPYCGREALVRSDMMIVQDNESVCTDCPLAAYRKQSVGIAVPLQHQGTVYGVLSLSLPPSFATTEEQDLVREVADDIGYALYSIELEEERVQHDLERDLTLRMLRQLHRHDSVPELISGVTSLLKDWSACEAVGIRLQQGDDYPYYETRGFPEEHVRLENSLCEVDERGETVCDLEGDPVLECMCGNVIRGRFDPKLAFFTESGSFWTNSTTDLLASTSARHRRAKTRNRCQEEGYESVALIPLRHGEQTLGLLQLNDSRRDQFSEPWIHLLERLADNLALALSKRQAEDGLREREHLFRQLFEQAPIGILIATADHGLIEVNQTALSTLGYSKEEMLGMSARDVVHPEDLAESPLQTNLQRLLSGETIDQERRFRTRDGEYIHVMVNMAKLPYYSEEASHMVMFQDISERKRMEERLREMSFFDSLTGLYNRNFFEAEMERLSDGRYTPLGIIVCDLDGLKFVNDTLGHQSGDEMLVRMAAILQQNFRSSDIIARIGGDEFAILLPSIDAGMMRVIAERLRNAMEEHNESTQWIQLSMSLGYAVSEAGELDMQALFREADNRMYREKIQKEQSGRSAIVHGLTRAIEARDFVTEGHCDRLQELAASLARHLDMEEDRINDLILLSRFHDLGKVGVPDRILFKPGPLTDDEYEEMKGHCEIGHRIAQSVPDLHPIAEWILKHHERWDGRGYPQGLSGEEIPLPCRILAIIDAYDAMTSERPYRNAMSRNKAVLELQRCAGTQFDPDLVEQFIQILEQNDHE